MPNTRVFIWCMRKKILHNLNSFKGYRFIYIGTRALEIFRDIAAIKKFNSFYIRNFFYKERGATSFKKGDNKEWSSEEEQTNSPCASILFHCMAPFLYKIVCTIIYIYGKNI